MTVLVTGASGFLGPRVVRHLCMAGLPCIRCFIRPNSDIFALERLRDQYPGTRIEYVVGNLLCLQDAIRATRGVEAVCHLAAEMHGLSPTVFANTVVASRNLLDGIVHHDVPRVVLVGSVTTYGVAHLHRTVSITEEVGMEAAPKSATSTALRKFSKNYFFSAIAASTSSNSSSCVRASSMERAGMFCLRELDSMWAVSLCRSGAATGFLSPMWRIVLPQWSTPPKAVTFRKALTMWSMTIYLLPPNTFGSIAFTSARWR